LSNGLWCQDKIGRNLSIEVDDTLAAAKQMRASLQMQNAPLAPFLEARESLWASHSLTDTFL